MQVVIDYELEKFKDYQIFIGLSAPSPVEGENKSILTWHKIDERRNIVKSQNHETEILINFGKFWKCGVYDWRLICIRENGRIAPLEMIGKPEPVFQVKPQNEEIDDMTASLAQGRFIVHSKGMRDQVMHEILVDHEGASFDFKNNRITDRGNFESVRKNMENYKRKGVSCLYMAGVHERDNYPSLNRVTEEIEFRKAHASPFAVTSRNTANKMHGGEEGFKGVMQEARRQKIKIIVDCLARVSSSRNHKKYRDLLLNYLDEEGRRKICYGTDGQSLNYEDTAMLNYRKKEAWDLLIQEIEEFAIKHDIDGIHLDNGQAWPQVMENDLEELMRLDVDGTPAYNPLDVLNGEIVIRNENHGYWNTNTMEHYPNPFFIKLVKKLWLLNPNFIIIAECWGGFMFESRQIILTRSGVIPRLFKLPQTISGVFGKRLHKDGRITKCKNDDVYSLKRFYEDSHRFLPEGSILIQSSTSHMWPYPAYLYGKATWAAVDILHFMSDIPMTFMGEIDGDVFRIGTTQVFQHEQIQSKQGLKRSNSQIMMALQRGEDPEEYEDEEPVETK